MPEHFWEYVILTSSKAGDDIQIIQKDGRLGLIPNRKLVAALNDFGREGWELVEFSPDPDPHVSRIQYIMKRQIAANGQESLA